MKRILVIGCTGLVGSRLMSLAEKNGFEAFGTHHVRKSKFSNSVDLDITDPRATLELVNRVRPKAVINTAAVTNVDYCETHSEEAQRTNVQGVNNLAKASQAANCRLVQVSTDFVFDGRSGHYTEQDTPNPVQVYGRTKLEAERVVSTLPSFAIARPSVIYGWSPPLESGPSGSEGGKPMNFAMFVIDKLQKNEQVRAVRDQYSSPTFADNLAAVLLRLAGLAENGLFHTAGHSCLSRFEFATKIADIFGYEKSRIQPVFSSEFKQVAERPKNSCLNVETAERKVGMRLFTAEEGIREMKKQSG